MLVSLTSFPLLQTAEKILREIFGGDVPEDPLAYHQVAARAAVVFILGLAIVRIGKSRLISRVTPLDVILGFILGSLLSRGITGGASISGTLIASATIVFVHWLFTAIACRWHAFGDLIKGHAYLLIKDGEVNQRAMLHSHISQHDLEEALRLAGLESVEEVHLAHKERNGEISFIKRKGPPVS